MLLLISIMEFDPSNIIEDKTPQPERTPELLQFEFNTIKDKLREKRNELLLQTDKYLIPDYPITSEQLILIKEYRQNLRDYMSLINDIAPIPEMPLFPF